MSRDLCIMACVFCRDPQFRAWVADKQGLELRVTEDEAKAFILKTCGITSRNDLDKKPLAAELFHAFVRAPFVEWRGDA